METNTKIIVGIVVVIVLIVLLMLATVALIFHYIHHEFSSGMWVNRKGDMLIIRNRGILADSKLKICENLGDTYNVLESKCRMIHNPLTLPHKFTLHILDDTRMRADIDTIKGKLRLSSGGKDYGTYYKNNL